MRLIVMAGILALWLLVAGTSLAQESPTLEDLVSEALAHNPGIRGGEAQWRMLVEKSRSAGSLADPMLMIKLQNGMVSDPLAFDQDPTTAKVLGLSQMIPFFGKRGLQREGVAKEAEAARWSLEERKVVLRQMVSENCAQQAYVETALQLVEKNLALLDEIGLLAEAAYKSGLGQQPDILRVQIERMRMEEAKYGLLQQQRSLRAIFGELLYREESVETVVPVGNIEPVTLSAAALQALALKSRPALFARSALIEQADAGVRLARREFYPDFTLSLEYMQRDAFSSAMANSDGADMYSAALSFNLPLQLDRRRAMVAEAQEQKRMAEAENDALRHEIRRKIDDLLAKLDASSAMARLYREGLLVQDAFVQESTLAAFRAGKTGFTAVLDSQLKRFGDEQRLAGFIAEYQILRAQLESTVGTPLP